MRQSEAIACLREKGYKQATLVLLFAAIDQLAWVAGDKETVGNEGFKAWVQQYMVEKNPELLSGATAADLWGARCGVLHTGVAESNDFRKGYARRILYASNYGQVGSNDPTVLTLSLEWLGSAFAAAIVWFLSDLEADPEKDTRAREKLSRMLVDQQP
ncbi:hypothetical protein [Janthinobacterium sp. PAMC25594]|uniref:hypothetical protein n=1 Tax=Janthinobacterium sp. PAMC25594 TaxID=2861284 RepID=UPI001C62853E|nr:hypothetical protein [Janthinobacterium sp. PAMC25594]QYG06800.1 hypothetical protein KY494_26835 [Janthinobacterium sp. PAMC25594]